MKYHPIYLIISLFSFSGCFGDKHPEYPYLSKMADSITFFYTQPDTVKKPYNCNIYYSPLVIHDKALYERRNNIYDLQGNYIKKFCLDSLFLKQGLEMSGKQTSEGYCILNVGRSVQVDMGGFYLFDFENEKLADSIPIFDFENKLSSPLGGSRFADLLTNRLETSGFRLPETPKRPHRADYDNHDRFKKAEKDYDKKLNDDYVNAVMDFAAKHKEEVYIYDLYNRVYRRNEPCFVFTHKRLAFKVEGDLTTDGFPYFADYQKPKVETGNPSVTFRQTGKASLGYRFQLIVSMVPWFEEEVIYYYELVCDGKTYNFKSDDGISLYDYKATKDYIYFALAFPSNEVELYKYKR